MHISGGARVGPSIWGLFTPENLAQSFVFYPSCSNFRRSCKWAFEYPVVTNSWNSKAGAPFCELGVYSTINLWNRGEEWVNIFQAA